MKRTWMRMLGMAGAASVALMIGSSAVVLADETICRGTLGAVTVVDISVPEGAICRLERTVVQGNIFVRSGARLRAIGVDVLGSIQAEGAAAVLVLGGSVVDGDIQVVDGGAARIDSSFINGSVLVDSNSGRIAVLRNRIGSDLQAFQNVGGLGVAMNTIDGNLQCKANSPAPIGGTNTVQGVKEDQCASL